MSWMSGARGDTSQMDLGKAGDAPPSWGAPDKFNLDASWADGSFSLEVCDPFARCRATTPPPATRSVISMGFLGIPFLVCLGISPPRGKAGTQTLASSLARSRISPAMGLAAGGSGGRGGSQNQPSSPGRSAAARLLVAILQGAFLRSHQLLLLFFLLHVLSSPPAASGLFITR